MIADSMPWKTTARNFPVETYIDSINKLHARGYSYADIAKFLNEQLASQLGGKKITRGQVYRVYQQALDYEDPLNDRMSVMPISDEDAEQRAEIEDKEPPEPEKTGKP